jgi:murein DD-endopeptidase MepM/ murein hydrolase activator NlpD
VGVGSPALDSFPAFGSLVVAPLDGVAAAVVADHPDQPVGGSDRQNPAGNYISLDIGAGRYLLFAHLKKSSALVAAGDRVRRGQPLAQVGNSGNTSEPHLHLQAQNLPRFSFEPDLETTPIVFSAVDVRRDDGAWTRLENADLRRGDVLRAFLTSP